MKRILHLLTGIVMMVFSYSVKAQNATPNPGFEEWTFVNFFGQFYIPNSWDNLDSATAIIGILTCQQSTDAHTGSYAAKLVTYEVDIFGKDTANGIITTGNLITVPPYGITGGIPYSERPDSIALWLKYTPAAGDSTQIQFDLFDSGGDTIGTALIKIGTTISGYSRFSAPVNYSSTAAPALSRWLISSSNGFNSIPGSVLYVDDLELLFTTGIATADAAGWDIQQTDASGSLIVSNKTHIKATLMVYDMLGKINGTYNLNEGKTSVSLSTSPGIFFCTIVDERGNVLSGRKIMVQFPGR